MRKKKFHEVFSGVIRIAVLLEHIFTTTRLLCISFSLGIPQCFSKLQVLLGIHLTVRVHSEEACDWLEPKAVLTIFGQNTLGDVLRGPRGLVEAGSKSSSWLIL